MNEFRSLFAQRLVEMLEFLEAIGYRADTHKAYLRSFDEFCFNHYPSVTELTDKIVLAWADSEQGCGVGANQSIRAFGEYLQAMGEDSYVLPQGYSSKKRTFNAYIFTDTELAALFREIDRTQSNAANPYIDIIAPVMFRLTYTCGLRPNESRELLCEHVNLATGEIFITHTKKQRERIVVMSDDMLNYARKYEQQRKLLTDDNLWFFPSPQGTPYSSATIDRLFKTCWVKANPDISKNELPPVRVYDLRNTHINKIRTFSKYSSICENRRNKRFAF